MHVNGLIEEVYGCATDVSTWNHFLEHLADCADAEKASLYLHVFATRKRVGWGVRGFEYGYEEGSGLEYTRRYAARNIYVRRIRERFGAGEVGTDGDLCTAAELRRSEFYEYCRRYGIFHTCWAVLEKTRESVAGFHVTRPEGSRGFEAKHKEILQPLLPHVRRAIALSRMVESYELREFLEERGERYCRSGVFRLEVDGYVKALNREAERLARAGDGLRLQWGRMGADAEVENARLQQILEQAMLAPERRQGKIQSAMLISRSRNQDPLELLVVPYRRSHAFSWMGTAALILVRERMDREAQIHAAKKVAEGSCEVVQAMYRLTATETRLVEKLVSGCDLPEAAKMMSMAPTTARFHMKRVYAKTGTKGQLDLVRFVLSR